MNIGIVGEAASPAFTLFAYVTYTGMLLMSFAYCGLNSVPQRSPVYFGRM